MGRNGLIFVRLPLSGAVSVEDARSFVDGSQVANESGYVHADIRGSVIAKTAIDGPASLSHEALYGAWGEPVDDSLLPRPRHQFVDFEPDQTTGYYYMGARVYDPTLRRWLSPDPLLWAIPERDVWQGAELNLFAYVGNNPVKFVDPGGYERIASADYNPAAVRDDRRGEIQTPKHPSPVLRAISKGIVIGSVGAAAVAVSPVVEALQAIRAASQGDYRPAAVSAATAALPVGRLKSLKALIKRKNSLLAKVPTSKIGEVIGAKKTKVTRSGGVKTTHSAKDGGFDGAESDFEALTKGNEVKTVKTYDGTVVRTSTLEDGREVILRERSSQGAPTLEVQSKNARGNVTDRSKTRYED